MINEGGRMSEDGSESKVLGGGIAQGLKPADDASLNRSAESAAPPKSGLREAVI
jgi:hypothetical protein